MLLVLSITFTFYCHYNIWGCMCSTCPFKFRWLNGYIYSSCYYHHQIGRIHLSHYYHIFFRGWVPEMFVTSYSVIYCTYIPGKLGFGFHLFAQFIVQIYFVECVNKIVLILSAIHYTIYGAVCFQFTPFPCDDWDNMHALSYNHQKSEVWTIFHCLELGHETMVYAVCLAMF